MITKKKIKMSAYTFLGVGFFFFINSFPTITGFAVLKELSGEFGRMISLTFLIIGVLLFSSARLWNRYKVDLVVREYESGGLNPVEAALKINDRLYPEGIKVKGIDYRGENKGTIRTEEENIPVVLHDRGKAQDLALALYEIALINDRTNARNCELHLGKQASSKHHRAGLDKVVKDFEKKYERSLHTVNKPR